MNLKTHEEIYSKNSYIDIRLILSLFFIITINYFNSINDN